MWDHKNKTEAIKQLKEKYNIDLSESFAYGDTNGDISMLKTVGHPIAINPSFELINSIQSDDTINEKVKIIVERKNVIYKLNKNIDITRGGR
jgi:phosphoserine phosphatase